MVKSIYIFCFFVFAHAICAQTTFTVNAGSDKKICPGAQIAIGGTPTAQGSSGPFQYTWHPGKLLYNYDSTNANPIATPNTTTTYTLVVKNASGEVKKSTVTVLVYPYSLYAGSDTTIKSGQTITLHAQAPGDSAVWWDTHNSGAFNENTLSPDVFPTQTTQYTIIAVFPHGCVLYDNLIVKVIPSTELFFYNSFSPNSDGVNDYFYIGNLGLYPNNTLEIYNRYGQKIYTQTPYGNDWQGSYMGTELPCGTYFYILDTHDDKAGKYRGEVNIIK